MPNGETCKHCGEEESGHVLGYALLSNDEPCEKFESTTLHMKECPVLGCLGNCAETIAKRASEHEVLIAQARQRAGFAQAGIYRK